MNYDVLKITPQELTSKGKIQIKLYKEEEYLFFMMALAMVSEIKWKNANGKKTVFICPLGPVGQYKYFVELVNSDMVSLKNVWFINMDEYMDDESTVLDINNPLSFRGIMNREVYDKINPNLVMPQEQRIFPDPNNLDYIPKLIEKLGGVDTCFGGIGINGHIAFNEPPEEGESMTDEEFTNLSVRVLKISRETLTINAVGALGGAIHSMPKHCITIGMKEILASKKIRLFCFRDWHNGIVKDAAFAEMSSNIPVTFLQKHNDAIIHVTENVARVMEI